MDENKLNMELERMREELNLKRIDRISKYGRTVSLGILVILFCLFVFGTVRFNGLMKDIAALKGLKQKETLTYDTLESDNAAQEQKKAQLESELMKTYGLTLDSIKSLSTTQVLAKSISANDAIKDLLKAYKPNQNVTVSYFDKTIDEKRVALELSALGYKFVQKPASEYMAKRATNAVWFGKGVPLDDIKIITLALVRAGVPVKGIRPYRSISTVTGYKTNIIEVGASVDLDNKPVMTVEEIRNAKGFER